MSPVIQNIFILTLVLGCAAFVVWQIVQSLRGKQSRAGSCCAEGCAQTLQDQQQSHTKPKRVVFMPVEFLSNRKS